MGNENMKMGVYIFYLSNCNTCKVSSRDVFFWNAFFTRLCAHNTLSECYRFHLAGRKDDFETNGSCTISDFNHSGNSQSRYNTFSLRCLTHLRWHIHLYSSYIYFLLVTRCEFKTTQESMQKGQFAPKVDAFVRAINSWRDHHSIA